MSNVIIQTGLEEGFSSTKYKCTKGFWTQGFGRNLDANPLTDFEKSRIKDLNNWTKEEANLLLQEEIEKIVEDLRKDITFDFIGLNNQRKSVIINMVYQLGDYGFGKFKDTKKYINNKDFDMAAKEMLDSKWYKKDTPERAIRMSNQMRDGEKWYLNN